MTEQNIYVGNLPYKVTAEDLETLFSTVGAVDNVRVISDRDSGVSKGFGFVTMASEEEMNAAITALNDTDLQGRRIVVKIATGPKPNRAPSPRREVEGNY